MRVCLRMFLCEYKIANKTKLLSFLGLFSEREVEKAAKSRTKTLNEKRIIFCYSLLAVPLSLHLSPDGRRAKGRSASAE